jgi:hypothetical protein
MQELVDAALHGQECDVLLVLLTISVDTRQHLVQQGLTHDWVQHQHVVRVGEGDAIRLLLILQVSRQGTAYMSGGVKVKAY